ncbi:MAG: glycosyltransferase [Cytophagales bacterium]|nr:glycosyltransferase [Cytophagales bacterium]MDW8383890.1 glycosyltransferase [Flammeovirgaceae bacterium]
MELLPHKKEFPFISVLIAARNEEKNIANCLHHLLACEYPREKLEIWVADDASEDRTAQIVQEFSRHNPIIHLYKVNSQLGNARGKANALAHLARVAKGTYWYFTDADVQVNPHWLQGLLSIAQKSSQIGIVTGFTIPKGGNSWIEYMQGFDWFYMLSHIKWLSDIGIPVTSMGNNMLVLADAYRATGGYENLPFSLTEDYELFKHIVQKGYQYYNANHKSVLAYTLPIKGFFPLIQQRSRWFYGAIRLPIYMKLIMILYSLVFLGIGGLWLYSLWKGIISWIILLMLRLIIFVPQLYRLNQKRLIPAILMYDVYVILVYSSMVLAYIFSPTIEWKGRKYKEK